MPVTDLLHTATHCVLALRAADGLHVVPLSFWYDGDALWSTTTSAMADPDALGAHDALAVLVPPADEGHPSLVMRGSIRVHSLEDPLALALHAPTISAAMAALAARNTGTLVGYARQVANMRSLRPHELRASDITDRMVLRIRVASSLQVLPPTTTSAVVPALPVAVPADVRRDLAGARDAVAVLDGYRLQVLPARLADEGSVILPAEVRPPADPVDAVIVLTGQQRTDPDARPRTSAALHGSLRGGTFEPARATWWRSGRTGSTDIAGPPGPGPVVLPD